MNTIDITQTFFRILGLLERWDYYILFTGRMNGVILHLALCAQTSLSVCGSAEYIK